MIKDTNQVKKTTNSSQVYPELTFKVVKNHGLKEMGESYQPECKFLELEIEPLDLGIEGLPKITKIIFYFHNVPQPHSTDKALNMGEYEKLFLDAAGKEFTMKPKKLLFGDRLKAKIGQELDYDCLTFSLENEIGEIKAKSSSSKKNNNFSEGDNSNSKTLKKALIIGGIIIVVLILVIFLFYWIWKEKNSPEK